MSTYIVNNQTIENILANIAPDASLTEQLKLGQAILELNINAVNQRYPRTPQQAAPFAVSDTWKILHCSLIKSYAALNCLLYQCSEGDVPEQPLFLRLLKESRIIGDKIIRALPQYEDC